MLKRHTSIEGLFRLRRPGFGDAHQQEDSDEEAAAGVEAERPGCACVGADADAVGGDEQVGEQGDEVEAPPPGVADP